MELERLQVVISAKTEQLQKQIQQVTNKLSNVNSSVDSTEKSFATMGDAGVKALSSIVKAAKAYNSELKSIAQYNARYDIWGGVSATKEQPWVTTVKDLKNAIADYKATIDTAQPKDPSDTLGFGKYIQEVGSAEDAIKRFNAILTEIYADRGPNEKLRMNAELENLAVRSREVKDELESLYKDMQLIRQIESGHIEATPGVMQEIERYNTLDVDKIKKRYAELTDTFASIRREIDETIKAMGGLEEAPARIVNSGIEPLATKIVETYDKAIKKVNEFKEQYKNTITVIGVVSKGVKGYFEGVVNATTAIGRTMWQLEPMHKIINRIADSIKSLGTRIRRVLVYSTIVSFFRSVKNEIGSFLTANSELMASLGQAKGAWITAFMPIYNYVLPMIISLINWLTVLGQKVALLTHRIFGGSIGASKAQAKAFKDLGGAAGGAAAEFKPILAAFDELNRLEEPDASGGGSGIDSLFDFEDVDDSALKEYLTWYDWLFDKTQKIIALHKELDKWLQKCANTINWFFKNVLQMFRGDNDQMAEAMIKQWRKMGRTLAQALNNFVTAVDWTTIGRALGAGLDLALRYLTSFVYTFDWRNFAASIAEAVNGAIKEVDWYNVGQLLISYWNIIWQSFVGFVETLDWTALGTAIADTINGALKNMDVEAFSEGVSAVLNGLFDSFVALVENLDWALLAEKIFELLIAALKGAVSTNNLWLFGEETGGKLQKKINDGYEREVPNFHKTINGDINEVRGIFNQGWNGVNADSGTQWGKTRSTIAEKVEGIKADATAKFDTIRERLSQSATNTKTAVTGAFQSLSSGLSPVLGGIKGAFSSAWSGILSDTSSKFAGLVSTVGGAVSSIGASVSSMLSTIGSGISSAWGSITGFVNNALAQLASVKIPHFASGGVITSPTVGLVGEYSGARTNPEIITPENLLRQVVADGNNDIVDAFISVGRQVIEAIENNNTEIRIGDDVISAAAARGDKDFKRRTGRSQFAY